MITVTIDFDGTLTLPKVQEYVIELIKDGVDVRILTSRYDDLHAHRYPLNPSNKEVWELIAKLGITPDKVHFMNMSSKGKYLYHTNVRIHLDNDPRDIKDIVNNSNTVALDVNMPNWKELFTAQLNIFKKLL